MLATLSHSIRSLTKTPGFTFIAVLTLALGIGANTAMFSMLNSVMLHSLPFPRAGQLDRIYRATAHDETGGFSPADYLDLKQKETGYGEIAGFVFSDMSISEPGQPAQVAGAARASANLFSVLEIKPQLGRNFRPEDALLGNHRILIISYRCWQNRFGGKLDVIGRTVRVDGEPHEIVGVLPATFNDWRFLGQIELFRPLGLTRQEISDRSSVWMRLVGHRAENVSRADAATFMANFGQRLAADFPTVNAATRWRTVPINDSVVDTTDKGVLAMLIGLSGFVLLIACSNLANLLLARTMNRAREFALRSALGATRMQLLRPLIAESVLLAFAGGVCAIFVAVWSTDWLTAISENTNTTFALDWSVLSWALSASLATALAFGIAPALFALRLDINHTLKSGSRGTTGGRGHQRLQHFLIVVQFTLSMILLAGAALFASALNRVNHSRYGWESEHLVTGTIVLPTSTYSSDDKILAFQRLALQQLAALPGVESASLSSGLPFLGFSAPRRYLIEGRDQPQPGQEPAAATNNVTPHYFETVGTRLLAGRTFGDADISGANRVFIINQAMANGLFGHANPIGRRIAHASQKNPAWGEIVGVVSDVKSVYPSSNPEPFQLYQPLAQEAQPSTEIAVRTADVAPSTLVDSIRTTLAKLDADLPVRDLMPAEARILKANYDWGILQNILSCLAFLGLGLAALGIYGVIARAVAQRTVEFGIRLALGAQVIDINRIVLASGVKLALTGSVLGLLGAAGVAKLISAGLPGMHPNNVMGLVGAAVLLLAVALLACWLPARRASQVDPMVALRAE